MKLIRRFVLPMTMGGVAVLGLVACGSDAKTEPAATTTAPAGHKAAAAEVSAGLKKIEASASAVAASAATDKAKAKAADEEIEPVWKTIEDTVKANEPDSYVAFEDAFSVLEKASDTGDGPKAQKASADVTKAVAAYLAKHPG